MIVESKGAQTFATGVSSVLFKAKRPGAKELQIPQVLVAELGEARGVREASVNAAQEWG